MNQNPPSIERFSVMKSLLKESKETDKGATGGSRRFTINLDNRTFEALEELAQQRQRVTTSALVREALHLYFHMLEELRKNRRLIRALHASPILPFGRSSRRKGCCWSFGQCPTGYSQLEWALAGRKPGYFLERGNRRRPLTS